eukprot:CAMPEP_0113915916 /NCGR_PEP_ID=MMETSP0780_2-20120614/31605_1 /TAXON_ID=652834 /ORGANISM="Palpitomonas bilix" /LENGTH=773 /DNA_ID=CAMNT_0000914753 /DNA_START=154 /DNA_END=2477 /DNA_ORIENTATION=+ /assembly_acc=CAM_ASM_000599
MASMSGSSMSPRSRNGGSWGRQEEDIYSIRARQQAAFVEMLDLRKHSESVGGSAVENSWKILIRDERSTAILSPLLTLSELRKNGVTLHLDIRANRMEVPDTPAVYFVEPTKKNIDIIVEDLSKKMYESAYIYFVSELSRDSLEYFARMCFEKGGDGAQQRVMKVSDNLDFISLGDEVFTLMRPKRSFAFLRDSSAKDTEIERGLKSISDGLFNVMAAMGTIPLIRTTKGMAAHAVGEMLSKALKEHKNRHADGGLFSRRHTAKTGGGGARPVLCIVEREVDLLTPVMHSWKYHPLIHDLLGMKLNKVELVEDGKVKPSAHYLDPTDTFWRENAALDFPVVAEQVERQLAEYKHEIALVDGKQTAEGAVDESIKGLMSTVQKLPELTEKKRLLDSHIKIASSLLKTIDERQIHDLHNAEVALLEAGENLTSSKSLRTALDMLKDESVGNEEDKLRLALFLLFSTASSASTSSSSSSSSAQLVQEIESALRVGLKRKKESKSPPGGGSTGGEGNSKDGGGETRKPYFEQEPATALDMLKDESVGNEEDKLRLALFLLFSTASSASTSSSSSTSSAQLVLEIESALRVGLQRRMSPPGRGSPGGDESSEKGEKDPMSQRAKDAMKSAQKIISFTAPSRMLGMEEASSKGGDLLKSMQGKMKIGFGAVKKLISKNRGSLPITEVVMSMSNAEKASGEMYDVFDPIQGSETLDPKPVNVIVFVVGGVSFAEAHDIKSAMANDGRKVVVGGTETLSPKDMIDQLEYLAQQERGGGQAQ